MRVKGDLSREAERWTVPLAEGLAISLMILIRSRTSAATNSSPRGTRRTGSGLTPGGGDSASLRGQASTIRTGLYWKGLQMG